MVTLEFKARLAKVNRETHDTSTLVLKCPKRPGFKPGQFFMVGFAAKKGCEKMPKRAYSASSSPSRKGILEFTVKEKPDGYVSRLLCSAKCNQAFIVDGPWGEFAFDEAKMAEIVMVAAGSGIAPFRAMCQYIADKGLKTKATLIYSARAFDDIIFREELSELGKKIRGMELLVTLSREQRKGFRTGRIDEALIKEIAAKSPLAHYFICGPVQMANDIEAMLLKSGIAKGKILAEKYG